MKTLLGTILAFAWTYCAQANSTEIQVNQSIPDGDLSGLASTINLSGLSGSIGALQLDLNISGTYNGDLYAYLVHDGGFSVLLNRPGRTASDSLGYGDGGLNVTFADGAANGDIHNYRSSLFGNASTALSGPLTGTWSPDGRQSSPFGVTDTDPRTALLSSFDGLDPNGDWTLFVADLGGGDLHQLNSWGLEFGLVAASVPDGGSTAGFLAIGLGALFGGILKVWPPSKFRADGRPARPWRANWLKVSSAALILTVAWMAAGEGSSGGRLTGWGADIVFPMNAYGATFTKIAAGGSYCLALKVSGTVVAWGDNYSGQCDIPAGLQGVVEIAAGDSHSLALRMDGTVVAWGDSYYGQCDVPAGLQGVVKIAAGDYHSLALLADGTLAAWGVFYGHPSALWDEPVPCVVPSGLSNVVAIAAGGTQCLALKSDGTVVAWGLVVDVPFAPLCAVTVPDGLTGVVGIAAGAGHCLAVKEDGTVAAWTSCGAGEYDVPSGLTNVIAIAAAAHNLALKGDGTVVAWGDNWAGKCDVPAGLDRVVAISAGGCESLVVREDGSLVVWGDNSMGRDMPLSPTAVVAFAVSWKGPIVLKEDGTVAGSPEPPPGLEGVVAVAAGESLDGYGQALKRDGTVVAWGDNEFGQCDVPQGLTGVVGIAAGGAHGLALRENGTVVAWGNNSIGQCDVPAGLNEVVAIAAGDAHSLALKADGTVVAWGNNFEGQCDVPGELTDVVAITGAANHSLALKSNGTVVGWGDDYFGQPDMPTAFGGLVAISTGVGHSAGLRADGTVIAWGADWTRAFDVPSGLSGVTAISAGAGDTWALFGGPTNRPPLAQDYALEAASNSVASLRLFALHAMCSDPDWDSFIVTGVSASSAAGGAAQIVGGAVLYTPPKDFVGNDSFTYTVRDSRGGISDGTVQVQVRLVGPVTTIPTIFNTGVDANHSVLADGTLGDPHFTLINVPGGTSSIRVRSSAGGWPILSGFYLADDSLSAWIGPNNDQSLFSPEGRYVYRTSFDLRGFDPSTARIVGQWSTDNEGVDILLNGVSIGNGANPDAWAFQHWTAFNIDAGFVAGINTLGFILNNQGGPTAMRAEMIGTANRLLAPATYELGASRNQVARLSADKLLRAFLGSNDGGFSVSAVSPESTAGGSVELTGDVIVYAPPLDFVGTDSFTYTLSESGGASWQGTVHVTVTVSAGSGPNILGVSVQPGGAATIRFAGIPGELYSLEASTDLITWKFLNSVTASPNGLLQFIDSEAAQYSTRYYRTRYGAPVNP